MTQQDEKSRVGFTPKELNAFKAYGVIVAAIAAAMFVVAPKGVGQLLGVLFAVGLFPVPPLVIYCLRRHKAGRPR